MKLSNRQSRVLLLGAALFALSELFPPWLYEDGWTSAERSAGYHFILGRGPEVKPYAEMKKIFSIPDGDPEHGFTARQDLARLYGQRFIIIFSTVGLLLVFSERRSLAKEILGGASLCVGLLFVGLYVWYVSAYLK